MVDDGSTDDTALMASQLGADVISQVNQGASAARATGLREVETDFVIFLDADDELRSLGVENSVRIFAQSASLVVVAGRVQGVMPGGSRRLLPRTTHADSTAHLVAGGHGPWPPAAAVIKRSALVAAQELGIEQLTTRFAEDYELMIRLSMVGSFMQHDVVSACYRLYSGKSNSDPSAAIRDKEQIRSHYARALSLPVSLMTSSEIRAASYFRRARYSIANKKPFRAVFAIVLALVASPALAGTKIATRKDRFGKQPRRSGPKQ